jgi:N-acetylglucosaminyldiphosphoundecaprenol N-acetyl-beta-D-mannosaminyltransferase
MNNENILGFTVTGRTQSDCIHQICTWVRSGGTAKYVVCVNPHSLQTAKLDPIFRNAILHADLIAPDGIGILIASRILRGHLHQRVTGSDLFWGVSRILNQKNGYRYFFLGSTEENLLGIQERMKIDFPNVHVAGTFAPSFGPQIHEEESDKIIEVINRAQPHVLWVGMTAPKQEKWVYQHRDRLEVRFIGPVGAVFAFLGGAAKRAHPWVQGLGLEWLSRFFGEPRRLWKRTFISAPLFLWSVLKQRRNEKRVHNEQNPKRE